ncbi:MAG: hypothetical protein U9M98_02895 [Patescibacteria group bacterium]|nr:hypothetical protein [Patescibacteria group bacterium]
MKKILLILVPVLVVAGVGAWYFLGRSGGQPVTVRGPSSQSERAQESKTYTGTLQKMVGLGMSLKCTWEAEGNSGTSWVKGDQTYTEVNAEGQVAKVIAKDDCMWSWSEGQAKGIKMCYDTSEAMYAEGESDTGDGSTSEVGAVKPPTDVQYNCRPATVSAGKFNPPSNVEFMDMQEMMQGNLEDLQNQAEDLMPEGM